MKFVVRGRDNSYVPVMAVYATLRGARSFLEGLIDGEIRERATEKLLFSKAKGQPIKELEAILKEKGL